MAVKRPGRDIDDAHAERFHGRKLAEALGELPKPAPRKPVAKRPGVVLDTPGDQQEENVADPALEPEARPGAEAEAADPEGVLRRSKRDRRAPDHGSDEPDEEAQPATTAAHLVFRDDHRRARYAQEMGFDQTPTLAEAAEALLAAEDATDGEPGVLLPSSAAHAHPDLPEAELRPPDFLSPLEAMRDVYLRVRGRASPKTRELLEGVALEDLVSTVRMVFEQDDLQRSSDARLRGPLYKTLREEPGPLLLGLADPRLTELWRLFIEGWDIWLPDGREDGVELFWEGESEDDDGEPMEILQTLSFVEGEVVLGTRLGGLEDELVFDGERFFRLSTKKPLPRRDG